MLIYKNQSIIFNITLNGKISAEVYSENVFFPHQLRPFVTNTRSQKWLAGDNLQTGSVDVYRCMANCNDTGLPLYIGNYASYNDVITSDDIILPANFKQFYGRHIKIAYNNVSL